jgi:prepilin-type N-terminal cleavage/methylation domain-containing protein
MDRSSPSSSQSGFALIEVIVSAAVLAMVALAVLSGIDGATHASGRERARSVAASLAEQDQERLRSMTIAALASYDDPPQILDVDGIKYTVTSTTKWVRDSTGNAPNCTDANPGSDYVHVRSTVTSNVVGTRTAPVTVDSIVAPPIESSSVAGTLVVQVNDQAAAPVSGLSVALAGTTAGTTSDTTLTDAAGCARFEQIPQGTYAVTLNRPGWVNQSGEQEHVDSTNVKVGSLAQLTMTYAQAGTVNLAVKSFWPCTTTNCTPAEMPSQAQSVQNVINGQPMRAFPDPALTAPAATVVADHLFPFTNKAYGFWSGSCLAQSPEKNGNAGYFDATRSVLVGPSSMQTKSLWQPGLNIRIAKDASALSMKTSTHEIQVKAVFKDATGDNCKATYQLKTMTRTDAGVDTTATSTNNYGWVTSTTSTAYDPGLPFGDYAICVWDVTSLKGFKVTGNYQNRSTTGNPTQLALANSSSFTATNVSTDPYRKTQTSPASTILNSSTWVSSCQ